MLTEAELVEMLDIRRKIDALQKRYHELAGKMAVPPPAGQSTPPSASSPAPVASQPVHSSAPQQQPVVVSVAQSVVQPPSQQLVSPTVPLAAPQPVISKPTATPPPPSPGAVPVTVSTDESETQRIPVEALQGSPVPPAPKDPASMTLKDHIADVLAKAGKPLQFEEIYKRLEEGKSPLPKDKPKLVVRQVLYNKAAFQTSNGAFSLVSGAPVASTSTAQKRNPVFKGPPGDLLKNRLDALMGKKK